MRRRMHELKMGVLRRGEENERRAFMKTGLPLCGLTSCSWPAAPKRELLTVQKVLLVRRGNWPYLTVTPCFLLPAPAPLFGKRLQAVNPANPRDCNSESAPARKELRKRRKHGVPASGLKSSLLVLVIENAHAVTVILAGAFRPPCERGREGGGGSDPLTSRGLLLPSPDCGDARLSRPSSSASIAAGSGAPPPAPPRPAPIAGPGGRSWPPPSCRCPRRRRAASSGPTPVRTPSPSP